MFQRLLTRLLSVAPDRWILKGGLALDFRLSDRRGIRPRVTKDMDLARAGEIEEADGDVRRAQELDLVDYFDFDIRRVELAQEDTLAGGAALRYQVSAILAGRVFERVLVDVGSERAAVQPDIVEGPDLLGFAGLPPVRVPALPTRIHVAEKVHAYTRRYGPDGAPSSRPKDLVDLVLLGMYESFAAQELRAALEQTFNSRGTHPLPRELPSPPDDWARSYRELADQVGIAPDLGTGYQQARAFLDPILSRGAAPSARWDESAQRWASD